MDLRRYLFEKEMTIKAFATSIGRSTDHIRGICKGRLRPSRTLARYIETMTEGSVTLDDLDEYFLSKQECVKD